MPNPSALITTFIKQFQHPPTVLASAPGRINLAGEHVDYNEGIVLPAAIDRALQVAAAPVTDNTITITAHDLGETVAFRLDQLDQRIGLHGGPLPSWALYPVGVAWSLQGSGYPVAGMQAVFTSDIPIGAGLSSSAAVEVAFAFAWQALENWPAEPLTLARLWQRAENVYAGVNCGLLYASHPSLRDLYEVGCPEIDFLMETSRKIPGCFGARLSGAGFGGCTVNLVDETQAQALMRLLHDDYQRRTG